MKRIIRFKVVTLVYCIIGFSLGCDLTKKDVSYLEKAIKSEEQQNYTQAIAFLNQAIGFSKDSDLLLQIANKGLDILKHFTKEQLEGELLGQSKSLLQIKYLRLILLYSQDRNQRISTQRSIADTYFNNIRDYHKAIEEFSRVLALKLPEEEIKDIRLKIARSYYHVGNFQQAKIELQKLGQNSKASFEKLLLKGHILLGERVYDKASLVFEDIIKKFPKEGNTDKIFLTLSLCYEEQKEFQKAISLLSEFLSNNTASLEASQRHFITMKIRRLEETYKMQPGVFQVGQTYKR